MTLEPSDLVLCSGTLPFDRPLPDRIEAAAAGGFNGLSLWMRDIERARADGFTDADIRLMFADHGIEIAELDPVWSWLPGTDIEIPSAQDPFGILQSRVDDFMRVAESIGGRSLNACDIFGGDWTLDDAAEAFASLCDRAAEQNLLVHLEFLPWSRIGDLGTAYDVVRRAGRPNGGVMLDAWHFFRSDSDFETLRSLPGDVVTGLQLSDAPLQASSDLMVEATTARRFPGEGECALRELLIALDDIDALAPRGVEVFSEQLQLLDTVEIGRRAGASVQQALMEAREER